MFYAAYNKITRKCPGDFVKGKVLGIGRVVGDTHYFASLRRGHARPDLAVLLPKLHMVSMNFHTFVLF
jgi:hypothetical protein